MVFFSFQTLYRKPISYMLFKLFVLIISKDRQRAKGAKKPWGATIYIEWLGRQDSKYSIAIFPCCQYANFPEKKNNWLQYVLKWNYLELPWMKHHLHRRLTRTKIRFAQWLLLPPHAVGVRLVDQDESRIQTKRNLVEMGSRRWEMRMRLKRNVNELRTVKELLSLFLLWLDT